MKKLFGLSAFCFLLSAFGYTSEDLSNANSLADQQIIIKQTVASKYGLDNKILRQEAIGMALKVKGVTLPENYKCKKYFADAIKNDWVCRAVELAADNGIISKSNRYANPGKYVTRAEALAMVMKAGGISDKTPVRDIGMSFIDANLWQANLLRIAGDLNLVEFVSESNGTELGGMNLYFYPNRLATRAEIFAFAKNILNFGNGTTGCGLGGVKVNTTCEIVPSETVMGDIIRFGDYIEVEIGEYGGYAGLECSIGYMKGSIQNGNVFYGAPSFLQIYTGTGKINAIDVSYEGSSSIILGKNGYYILGGDPDKCASDVTFSDIRQVADLDVLLLYYKNIKGGDIYFSYHMRSPAGVSQATFESWYKNTESVTFREDTLKSLGDNTYEFLVDTVENGKKSTFKVKSKVNLEKFTIDNISSVKQ